MALKLWLSAGAFVALTTHLVFFLLVTKQCLLGALQTSLMQYKPEEIVLSAMV
jgi:hypothetical protein